MQGVQFGKSSGQQLSIKLHPIEPERPREIYQVTPVLMCAEIFSFGTGEQTT
jgi:hypothetical protein